LIRILKTMLLASRLASIDKARIAEAIEGLYVMYSCARESELEHVPREPLEKLVRSFTMMLHSVDGLPSTGWSV
jgi:hypothetical protein